MLDRYTGVLQQAGVEYGRAEARDQYRAATTYNLRWPVMASIRYEAASDRGRVTLDTMVRRLGAAIERQTGH